MEPSRNRPVAELNPSPLVGRQLAAGIDEKVTVFTRGTGAMQT
jgi:hypothetical protein